MFFSLYMHQTHYDIIEQLAFEILRYNVSLLLSWYRSNSCVLCWAIYTGVGLAKVRFVLYAVASSRSSLITKNL